MIPPVPEAVVASSGALVLGPMHVVLYGAEEVNVVGSSELRQLWGYDEQTYNCMPPATLRDRFRSIPWRAGSIIYRTHTPWTSIHPNVRQLGQQPWQQLEPFGVWRRGESAVECHIGTVFAKFRAADVNVFGVEAEVACAGDTQQTKGGKGPVRSNRRPLTPVPNMGGTHEVLMLLFKIHERQGKPLPHTFLQSSAFDPFGLIRLMSVIPRPVSNPSPQRQSSPPVDIS